MFNPNLANDENKHWVFWQWSDVRWWNKASSSWNEQAGSRLKSKQRKVAQSQLVSWDTVKSQSWVYLRVSRLTSLGSILEKAMAPHSSTLAWKLPWTEKPGRLQSMGSLRVGHDWATSLSLFIFMHWRRKWPATPVFLPGESQGQGEPDGLPSMGSHRVGHDWSDLAGSISRVLLNLAIPSSRKRGPSWNVKRCWVWNPA